jgi:hypothetical protein
MNEVPLKTDKNRAAKSQTQPDVKARIVSELKNTCVWFTVLSLCILLITLISSAVDETSSAAYLRATRFLLLLPFALCATLAGDVRRSSLPAVVRGILHPVLSLGGFILFIYLPVNLSQGHTSMQTLLWILAILVIYLVGFLVYIGISHAKRSKKGNSAPYQSQFHPRQ